MHQLPKKSLTSLIVFPSIIIDLYKTLAIMVNSHTINGFSLMVWLLSFFLCQNNDIEELSK